MIRPVAGRAIDPHPWSAAVNSLIYLVGLIVIILAVLSFFGLS